MGASAFIPVDLDLRSTESSGSFQVVRKTSGPDLQDAERSEDMKPATQGGASVLPSAGYCPVFI